MAPGFNKAALLMLAAALFASFASQAAAQPAFDWECAYDGKNYTATMIASSPQWFLINVQQDKCREVCEKAIKHSDLDPDAKAATIAYTDAVCNSDSTKSQLLRVREVLMDIQSMRGIAPNAASQQVLDQEAACDDTRFACADNVLPFLERGDLNAQKKCIDQCGAAASACNALAGRGDFDDVAKDFYSDLANAARTLATFCS